MNRTDVAGMIPADAFEEIFNAAAEQSAVLSLGKRLRNMNSKEMSLTVQDTLPIAGFVSGDDGLKPTSGMQWKDIKITAEEIAVLVPVPDAVLADARSNGHDLWSIIRPNLSTAIGKVIDAAVLFGTNKPASWPTAIVPGATAAAHAVVKSADGYADIMGEGGLISMIEADGFMANGYIGALASRAWLRSIRSEDGIPLFNTMPDPITKKPTYTIDGESILFPKNGAMEGSGKPLLIGGDFEQLVYSIREDVKFDIFNTGVISDADGKVILNLMQQDTSVIRVYLRMGWQLPNPVNHINTNAATRYPFAVLNNA